ncbi:Rv2407 family type 3 sulfatase [soil metagenome]
MKVTLLGTGMPQPDVARRGPSQTIEVGDDVVLVDCGAGTLHRLLESGQTGARIRRIALTHLHSDHTTGLADLLWAGWTQRWWSTPPAIVGPPGTKDLLRRLIDAYSYDVAVRTKEGAITRGSLEPAVVEVEDGWADVMDHWRLAAFRVDHSPVDQAFGFRFDSDAGSVVVSGDTCRSESLIRNAHDTDLLIHEVIWRTGMDRLIAASNDPREQARWERILRYHTPADDLGGVATESGARHLVLTHIIAPGGTPTDLERDVRRGYDGPLTTGEDLATFRFGESS